MTIGSSEDYSDSMTGARHAQDAKIAAIKDQYKPMLDKDIPESLRETRSGPKLHYGFCLEIPRGEPKAICQGSWSRVLDHIDSQTGTNTGMLEGLQRFVDAGSYAMTTVRGQARTQLRQLPDCPSLCSLVSWKVDVVTENHQVAAIMLYTNKSKSKYQEHHVKIVVDALKRMFIPPGVTDPIDIQLRWYYDGEYRKDAYIREN